MGVHENISYDRFPRQSDHIGKGVYVAFHYDLTRTLDGVIVRDDTEEPGRMIIKCGPFYYLSTECQFSFK